MKAIEYPILFFKNHQEWRKWLDVNHTIVPGIWLQICKKDSKIPSVTYDEALDHALCFGWIDGQVKKYDIESYLQKFTPRRQKSIWSKRNRQNVARLQQLGLLMPKGIFEVERAKNDGRWQQAYDSQSTMIIPQDFIQAVKQNKKTLEFYNTLNKSNLFTIYMQLQSAKKPETRAKRFNKLLQMLQRGEKPS